MCYLLGFTVQCALPLPPATFSTLNNNNNNIIIRQSGYVNLIDSHATLQRLHFCKLNTIT